MLLTSQRTSHSNEELVYERVNLVRAREDTTSEQVKSEQIKISDSDEEPDHERVNFVRALVEQEVELIKFSPIKSEQIRTDIVASHLAATSNATAMAAEKKAEHIKLSFLAESSMSSRRMSLIFRLSCQCLFLTKDRISTTIGHPYSEDVALRRSIPTP